MGTCPTNTDGSLTPFVAKYCTALGYDMDMMRTMSGQEMICAMSEKLNEVVCFDNETRDLVNEQIPKIEAAVNAVPAQVTDEVNDYFESSGFNDTLNGKVDEAVENQNLVSRVTQLETDVDNLQNKKSHMVVIGDSFSDQSYLSGGTLWCSTVASRLNCQLHNYAVGGTGFFVGAKTFGAQISEAAADSAFENSEVEWVFIYGGVNDFYNGNMTSSATVTAEIKSVMNAGVSSFPNAKVVYLGSDTWASGFCGLVTLDSGAMPICELYFARQAQLSGSSIAVLNLTCFWLGQQSLFGDNDHPNQDGHNLFAEAVLTGLNGSTAFLHGVDCGTVALKSGQENNWAVGNTAYGINKARMSVSDRNIKINFMFGLTTGASAVGNATVVLPMNLQTIYSGNFTMLPAYWPTYSQSFDGGHNSSNMVEQTGSLAYFTQNNKVQYTVNVGSTHHDYYDMYDSFDILI